MSDYVEWQASYRLPDVPEAYRAMFHGWELRVDDDPEFGAWTWSVRNLETGVLLDSGMSRYDGEAIKRAETAVRYHELGVRMYGR